MNKKVIVGIVCGAVAAGVATVAAITIKRKRNEKLAEALIG